MTLKKAVDYYPSKIAVVDGGKTFTYDEVGKRTTALARFFQERAIQPKDRISILEVNSHAFLETYYAAAGIGAILNPLNYRLAAKEVAYILKDADSRWLVAGSRFADLVEGILQEDVPLEGVVWIGDSPTVSHGATFYNYEDAIRNHKGPFESQQVRQDDVAPSC